MQSLAEKLETLGTQLETALRYPDDVDWPSIATTVPPWLRAK